MKEQQDIINVLNGLINDVSVSEDFVNNGPNLSPKGLTFAQAHVQCMKQRIKLLEWVLE